MHAQTSSAVKPSLEFKDPLKQRVCYYFQAHRDGDWQHFLENWPRAHQVDRSKFKEVHRAMQVAGAIPLIEGGKAHEILKRDIEKDVRAKVEQEMAEKDKETWGQAPEAPAPTAQDLLQNQPAIASKAEPTIESMEPEMPAKATRNQIDEETKEKAVRIISAAPNLNWEDFEKKMGASSKQFTRSNFYQYKSKVRNGGVRPKPGARAAQAPVGAALANGPTILKSIPCDAMDKTVKKTLREFLPTILSQVLGSRMAFKVIEVIEDDENRLMILRTA